MNNLDYSAIGQRIKLLRKRKGLNQKELAGILGKSLRTVQKYETGEIEVSIAVVNQLADILESTPTYILGYEANTSPIRSLADIMGFLFQLEQVTGISFDIDVKKPPRSKEWQCAISFNGKASSDFNTDLCLFLEDWESQRDDIRAFQSTQAAYQKWQEQTLAYYAATSVECVQPEELSDEERIKRRNAYLESQYARQKEE
ncbi:MAG: helix-turn-helix transcriptional regulator [Oscillibacter sp.]|jgi:transcriptional regulator with XRE-family HTH domain|nr:helix-turn-helix transcriptional regulator [Oscillibacter sp.]